ncbi:MAG: hypothetical protein DMF80_20095 [Acidobacteria bacterium]|nr:MAG: hypothetical protein DMF80_20095 [Acidobacteriota bacterium]
MKTASWILIAIAAGLTLLGGLVSLGVAYGSTRDQIGPASLGELSGASPGVGTAVRARRATAAAYAAGFGTLLLAITLGPYRRGDLWAWWAILAGVVVESVLSMLRVPFLGTRARAGPALLQLVVVGVGLALGAGRLRGADPPS